MSRSSDASKPSSANSDLFAWFDRRFVPPLQRLSAAPALVAVREALPWSFIGLVAGLALFMLLVPVKNASFGEMLGRRISLAALPAFGVMASVLVVVLAAFLALSFHLRRSIVVPAACAAFVLALPQPFAAGGFVEYLRRVGEGGLFLAIVVALAVAVAARAGRTRSSEVLGAAAVVAVVAALAFAHISLADELVALLRPLGALGDTYAALLVITVVETLLWTIGVHGPATLAAVVTPVYLTLQLQNTAAYAQHAPLPHIVVVSLFLFVFPGGAGATLPLALLLAFSRVERLRRIARLAAVPALFNINEPLLFGLPLVLNPFLAIPFVVVPAILATTTYAAVALHWVGRPAWYVPSNVPTLVSTYLATLDPRAVVLTLVNLAIATAVYLPFVRAYERHEAGIA